MIVALEQFVEKLDELCSLASTDMCEVSIETDYDSTNDDDMLLEIWVNISPILKVGVGKLDLTLSCQSWILIDNYTIDSDNLEYGYKRCNNPEVSSYVLTLINQAINLCDPTA